LEDLRHAEEMEQKIREEEEIQVSIRMQDEIVAKKLAEKERKHIEDHRHQVQEDARLARQASEAEARAIRERRRREEEMSEREAMRLAERHRKKRSRPPLGCRTRLLLRNWQRKRENILRITDIKYRKTLVWRDRQARRRHEPSERGGGERKKCQRERR
jgi:hypothetical protein